jgi:hypothetical protein
MVYEDADVTIGYPRHDHIRLAVEDHLLRRNDPTEELAPFLLLALGH